MPYLARSYQITQSLSYHIFSRGNAKNNIYHDNDDYQYFVKILISYSKERKVKIFHWVIMSNHYHLLMEIENPKELSSVMAGIARSYVHYHHKKYNSAGHLFQDRFKSQAIQKELYLLACGRYIEQNPLKIGQVSLAEDYPFSSAAYYVYGKEDGLTQEDPLFSTFGKTINERQQSYRVFLKEFNANNEESFSHFEKPQGSEEFIRRLVKEKGMFVPRNGRPRKKVYF